MTEKKDPDADVRLAFDRGLAIGSRLSKHCDDIITLSKNCLSSLESGDSSPIFRQLTDIEDHAKVAKVIWSTMFHIFQEKKK